jgi:hypothetical protein
MEPMHTVAILKTESGLQFILDPTAAQYGWSENIAPRDIYTQHRIDHDFGTSKCDPPDRSPRHTKLDPRPKGKYRRLKWESACVAEHIVRLVRDYLEPSGGLSGVVQLPQAQFDGQLRVLKAFLSLCMEDYEKSFSL